MLDGPDTQLRVITADDWEVLRTIRLRALAESPEEFGARLADAQGHPEAEWRRRAGGAGPVVLALSGQQPVAMGGLFLAADSPDAMVWGMWTEPEWRGRGLARQVLERLLIEAGTIGRAVVLHVTEGNDAARRLYAQLGFAATGEWQPLRDGSAVRAETLRWSPS
ncbi:GNAT family N-acetyltransferase [Nocardioides sp. SYSU D00038]|uniref:GNAT family N-acetyltransferase n=1 Tax=Nocardioides sp. SYSU D00038 TaxID=2812554 RepID=UPI001967E40E|nr:GNAT family N-acetyltransferase [Nocardioides sp. SYSU D00038]